MDHFKRKKNYICESVINACYDCGLQDIITCINELQLTLDSKVTVFFFSRLVKLCTLVVVPR